MSHLLLLALFLIAPLLAYGQEPLQSERLTEINLKVSKLQDEQKLLATSMQNNEKALSKLNQEVIAVQASLQVSAADLELLKKSSLRLTGEIADFSLRFKELAEQSSARLRSLYMLGGGSQMAVKVSSEGRAGLSQISYYMNALRRYEVFSLAELRRLGQEKSMRVEELQLQSAELEKLKKLAEDQRAELKVKQVQLEAASQMLKKQRSSKSKIISELRAESLRLETVLSSLVGEQAKPEALPPSLPSLGSSKPTEDQQVNSGDGLGSKFTEPKGSLVTKFGATVSDGLDQKITSKGLGYVVPIGQDVTSVGAGKVSFTGVLGAYGNVVIVDHNFRVYTLYSQLESISVQLGQQVESGHVIGKAGEITAPRPYNFYFELRKQGSAVNPKPFMR